MPKSSIPISVQAIGVLVAPAKTATKPNPARKETGKGNNADNALPSVAPTKKSGVTSPPLNPTPMVNVVSNSFNRKSYHICTSVKELTITGTPRPIYLVVPISQTHRAIQIPPSKGRKGAYGTYFLANPLQKPMEREKSMAVNIMGKKGRKENRQYRIVTHTSHHDDLQGEDSPGQRSTEYRRKTGTDTYLYHNLAVVRMHLEETGQEIGYSPSHLHTGTFASCRTSEEMCQYRTDIDQRSHLERNDIAGSTDFFNQKIISAGSRTCQVMIHQPDEQSGQRQQTDDPDMTLPVFRGPSQRIKQQGGSRTNQPTGNGRQDQPFQTIPENDFFETGPTKTIL